MLLFLMSVSTTSYYCIFQGATQEIFKEAYDNLKRVQTEVLSLLKNSVHVLEAVSQLEWDCDAL